MSKSPQELHYFFSGLSELSLVPVELANRAPFSMQIRNFKLNPSLRYGTANVNYAPNAIFIPSFSKVIKITLLPYNIRRVI